MLPHMTAPPLITRLWTHARDALMRLRASLPRLDTLFGAERRAVRTWLRAIEALARKTVLLEAMQLAAQPAAAIARAPASAKRASVGAKPLPALRLWPRFRRAQARARQLGPPLFVREIWREQARRALLARLRAGKRRPAHIRLADRLDALERLIAAPLRAARRLARKLRVHRRLAYTLAAARAPRCAGVDSGLTGELSFASYRDAIAFNST